MERAAPIWKGPNIKLPHGSDRVVVRGRDRPGEHPDGPDEIRQKLDLPLRVMSQEMRVEDQQLTCSAAETPSQVLGEIARCRHPPLRRGLLGLRRQVARQDHGFVTFSHRRGRVSIPHNRPRERTVRASDGELDRHLLESSRERPLIEKSAVACEQREPPLGAARPPRQPDRERPLAPTDGTRLERCLCAGRQVGYPDLLRHKQQVVAGDTQQKRTAERVDAGLVPPDADGELVRVVIRPDVDDPRVVFESSDD